MLKIVFLAFVSLSVLACNAQSPATAPAALELKPGPHLFVDDYLIAQQDNLERFTPSPTRLPQPIVTGVEDGCFQPYLTVLRDPTMRRIYRMWYGVPARPPEGNPSHLAYMESRDGIHWQRPHQVLEDPGGLEVRFGCSVIDDGPDAADPGKRYKFGFYWGSVTDPPTGGLMIATSPDGRVWTPLTDTPPVLKHVGDINNIWRDPIRKRYVATFTDQVVPRDTKPLMVRNVLMQSYSDDLLNWTTPREVMSTDSQDPPTLTRFYGLSGFVARGDLLVGTVKVLEDDQPADARTGPQGTGYTALAFSRDGEHWQRERAVFLDRNSESGTWDHAMAWIDCQLMMGDEVYLYYGGYKQGHKVNRFTERQIGVARMPRDRYIGHRADSSTPGTLRTVPLILAGSRLSVNASVQTGGELRVRILNDTGEPIKGFDFADCVPIRGDAVTHALRWNGADPASLQNRPVSLEFSLRNASLFSFDLYGQ